MKTSADLQRLRREFPGFPLDSLPPIPDAWEDLSNHNESSPRFRVKTRPDKRYLSVWIEHPDPSKREVELSHRKRYFVDWTVDGGGDTQDVCESDNWAEILLAVATAT